jgi:hypothetical protein
MLIVSFAWTTPALRALAKVCTRRNWTYEYAQRFIKAYRLESFIAAWDHLPRVGGHRVGTIKLMEEPFKQRTGDMTEQDYHDEGLEWMEAHHLLIKGIAPRDFFEGWKRLDEEVYVLRFRFTPKT